MAEPTPLLTASGEVIYGETPEDGIVAMVYGDPELAAKMAVAVNMHGRLVTMLGQAASTLRMADRSEAWKECRDGDLVNIEALLAEADRVLGEERDDG